MKNEMKKYINSKRKELIYELYATYVPTQKDYDKITKGKMLEEIRELIRKGDLFLEDILDIHHIESLIKKEAPDKYFITRDIFLYERFEDDVFYMYPEFVPMVEKLKVTDLLEEREYFRKVIYGMMKTYGGLGYVDINNMYAESRDPKYKDLPLPTVETVPYLKMRLHFDGYDVYNDAIFDQFYEKFEIEPVLANSIKKNTNDYFYQMCTYSAPIEFHQKYFPDEPLKEYNAWRFDRRVMEDLKTDPYVFYILKSISEEKDSNIFDEEEFRNHSMILDFPIWVFGGYTYHEYVEYLEKRTIGASRNTDFILFLDEVVLYAIRKYKLVKGVSSLETLHRNIYNEMAFTFLNESLAKPGFVKSFVASRSYTNTEHINEFIAALESYIVIDLGYAYEVKEDVASIFSNDVVYHVKGITQPIGEIIRKKLLPTMLRITLFPLEDTITYGISLQMMGVSIGPGLVDVFKKDIAKAHHVKKIGDIRKALNIYSKKMS